jgi:hypothetical protein
LCCEGGFSVIVGNNHLRKKYIRGEQTKKSKKGYSTALFFPIIFLVHIFIFQEEEEENLFPDHRHLERPGEVEIRDSFLLLVEPRLFTFHTIQNVKPL